jgi:hypothetical protein
MVELQIHETVCPAISAFPCTHSKAAGVDLGRLTACRRLAAILALVPAVAGGLLCVWLLRSWLSHWSSAAEFATNTDVKPKAL